jgi:hypothetical protein
MKLKGYSSPHWQAEKDSGPYSGSHTYNSFSSDVQFGGCLPQQENGGDSIDKKSGRLPKASPFLCRASQETHHLPLMLRQLPSVGELAPAVHFCAVEVHRW